MDLKWNMSLIECYLSKTGFCKTYGITDERDLLDKVLYAGGEFI